MGITEQDIYSLSVAEVNGATRVFAGTEPAHLFVSDDLGLTWTEKSALHAQETEEWRFPAPPHVAHLKHISFHPDDSGVVYASIEQGGLYRSDDGGESFAEIPGMYNDVHRLVSNPAQPERLFVTGGMGLWLSRDYGTTWDNVFSKGSEYGGYPDQLVYKPSDPSYMLIAAGQESPGSWRQNGTAETRISRTRDAGETWEVLSATGLADKFAPSVEAMTLEEAGSVVQVFAATTYGEVLWSEDGGESWEKAVSDLPAISKGRSLPRLRRRTYARDRERSKWTLQWRSPSGMHPGLHDPGRPPPRQPSPPAPLPPSGEGGAPAPYFTPPCGPPAAWIPALRE